jgi:uncharacterized membrane protein YccC
MRQWRLDAKLPKLGAFVERESLRPDLGRATRAMLAFVVPVVLAISGWLPPDVTFAAIAAQNINFVDVRGAYSLRITILLAMALQLTLATWLGVAAGGSTVAAVAATAGIALLGGLWRHLSPEYGPSLATPTALLFFIALAMPEGAGPSEVGAFGVPYHAWSTLIGALWGIAVQVAMWPINAQHPLRRIVGESWLAAADLFDRIVPDLSADPVDRHKDIGDAEGKVRNAIDSTDATLHAAVAGAPEGRRAFITKLQRLQLLVAQMVTRVSAVATATEMSVDQRQWAELAPALQAALTSLANTTRAVALAIVSRQPAHLAAAEVALHRARSLLQAVEARVEQEGTAVAVRDGRHIVKILRSLQTILPDVGETLRSSTRRAGERAAFGLELFDLNTWRLRPLAAALNLTPRVEPAIVRFAARSALLLIIGVLFMRMFPTIHHGYWLPFTIVIVLQPDYGSTRKKAAQRVLGTIVGGVLGGLVLLIPNMHQAVVLGAMAVAAFWFGFFLRKNYAVAVVFITLFGVLLMEAEAKQPVKLEVTLERLAFTAAGGALALLGALIFWPQWERSRFPALLSGAMLANRDFLLVLVPRLESGRAAYDQEVVRAKKRTERASSEAFQSLRRMFADPENRRAGVERAAVLANGNQRLTRVLNVLMLHLTPDAPPVARPELRTFGRCAARALETLASKAERLIPSQNGEASDQHPHDGDSSDASIVAAELACLRLSLPADVDPASPDGAYERSVFAHLGRAGTELIALLMAEGEGEVSAGPNSSREPRLGGSLAFPS